ncbi:L-threonylcarbamoyladenylate synthase [Paenisporosarcina cavernae]|uniref:Threonylcarbamoyl-AMP synthase n=1 Tax=Paenisporosarcina cavernae TaxID=2320858 RepID=A0A385YQZ8_9BACL|nr:L-threonylcarbamoyladenylate synthase [Paenisporosarcina cavernae]AYC28820.1 threonylcarbamoyl-AMP synthase [Paenisporosarcina cavernae]
MKTEVLDASIEVSYDIAAKSLLQDELVAFPTETVYGLGAIATSEQAVAKIFAAKGRPSDNPLIVHVASISQVEQYVTTIPDNARKAMEAFWPGALTVVLPAKQGVFPPNVTAGLSTVGLRVPNHPVARKLLEKVAAPIAAPSSNRSGKPSPTSAAHVVQDLQGVIPYIVDGGETAIGVESTVVDFTVTPPAILRPGGVTEEMLRECLGDVASARLAHQSDAPKAPGMKYAHYAPDAPVFLVHEDRTRVVTALHSAKSQGHKVALIAPSSFADVGADVFMDAGESVDSFAARVFSLFRACNASDASVILVTVPERAGVGEALFNRIEKAAAGKWWVS